MNENSNNQYNTPQPPMYSPPPPPMGFKPPGHGMAIASLVMGILSLVLWCCYIGYIIFAPLGIIFAVIARRQGSISGMATAGLVTSIISIASAIIFWVVFVAIIGIGTINWMDFI